MSRICTIPFFDDDDGGFSLRPESWDWGIARAVVVNNEYRLPERFRETDVVIDIGAHIGSFAYACLRRGAGKVISFEPDPENAALAARNLAHFGSRCELHAAAVWRSDGRVPNLLLGRAKERLNTGGHSVVSDGGGVAVPVIALDAVLASLAGPIRLLKIDCEGAEYPILFTSRHLDRVASIVGEFHRIGPGSEHGDVTAAVQVDGVARYDEVSLAQHLRARGYEVELAYDRDGDREKDHGLFFAHASGDDRCSGRAAETATAPLRTSRPGYLSRWVNAMLGGIMRP